MRYKSNENFVVSNVAGESVLVPIAGTTAKMGDMYTINETGSDIIKAMEEGLDFEEIVVRLNEEYDIDDQERLRADVSGFIAGLVGGGFFQEV